MSEDKASQLVQEAHLCDKCGKIHVGEECGTDILDGDQFILEFEQLPPDEHIQKLRKTVQQLRDDRWQAVAAAQRYKRKANTLANGLVEIQEEVKKQKYALGKLKTDAEQNQRMLHTEYKALIRFVKEAIDHVAGLEKCDGSCVHIKAQYQKLCKDHEKLKEVEKNLQEHIMLIQVKLQEKSKEADTMTLHAKNRDISSDQKLTKIQKEFAHRETEIKTLKKDFLVLQHRLEEEQENTAQALQSGQEIADKCEDLQDEILNMRNTAHTDEQEKKKLQDRIKELQEQVKKMKSGVKDKVENEMLKMMKDMDEYQNTLEKRLQQDVEKEKEKMRKELEDYIVEYRENQSKMVKTMRGQTQKYKETIADLQQQVDDVTLEAEQKEKLLQAQIAQLNAKFKLLGSHAGSRKPSVTPTHGDYSGQLKEKDEVIASLQSQIDELNEQISELKAQLELALKEKEKLSKINDLEALVQKEIEERTSIMEAYNKLKEELDFYKQQATHKPVEPEGQHYSSVGPLTILQKHSVDKYAPYRATESTGYDISELTSHGSKSGYERLMELTKDSYAKSLKSITSYRSGDRIAAKSSKSVRSIHSDRKSSKSNQDSFMNQLAAKSSKSERTPYEIASQALQRTARTNRSYQDVPRDRDNNSEVKTGGTLTKYNSMNQLSEKVYDQKTDIKPIGSFVSKSAKSQLSGTEKQQPIKSANSLTSHEILPPLTDRSGVSHASEPIHPEPKDFLVSPKESISNISSSSNSYSGNTLRKDDPKLKDSSKSLGDRTLVQHYSGKEHVLNRNKYEQLQNQKSLDKDKLKTNNVINNGNIATENEENNINNKRETLPFEVKSSNNQINTSVEYVSKAGKVDNKNEVKVDKGHPLMNKLNKIPGINPDKQQDKKVAFKDKLTESNHNTDFRWKAKAVVPPVQKSKSGWHPSFETGGRTSSQATTPSGFNQSNHPLHNPSSESMSSMSNISTPSLYGNSLQNQNGGQATKKGNLDVSRGSLMKALNERKGTASNSAWKIYQHLKVGRM